MQKITPFLWFDNQAEETVNFYISIFKNAKIEDIVRYGEAGSKASGRAKGSAMTVSFTLEGQEFIAMDSGRNHQFTFTEATSFVVNCEDQKEIDYFWEKLSEGGDKKAQQCGWLKDKYGMSWQIVPTVLRTLQQDTQKSERVMQALLQMKKIEIEELQGA